MDMTRIKVSLSFTTVCLSLLSYIHMMTLLFCNDAKNACFFMAVDSAQ